jgi:hypothetical protein
VVRELTSGLLAGDDQGLEINPDGVNRGCTPGAARANDDDITHDGVDREIQPIMRSTEGEQGLLRAPAAQQTHAEQAATEQHEGQRFGHVAFDHVVATIGRGEQDPPIAAGDVGTQA